MPGGAVRGHVERLGAALLHPRRALSARLDGGPGGLADILPWTLLAAAIARPAGFGQSLLLFRTDLWGGFLRLAQVWSALVAPVLIAIVVISILAPRSARPGVEGGDVFDAGAFALIPLVFLIGIAALLEAAGVPREWLPLSSPRGAWPRRSALFVLRYGWSFAILVLLLSELGSKGRGAIDGETREA